MKDRLWHLLARTAGGPNRADIIEVLDERPTNANQVAEHLDLNYNTVRYHLEVLEDHGIVDSSGDTYGEVYYLTERFDLHQDVFERIVEEIE